MYEYNYLDTCFDGGSDWFMGKRAPYASAFSLTSAMPLNFYSEYTNRKAAREMACPSKENSLIISDLCKIIVKISLYMV